MADKRRSPLRLPVRIRGLHHKSCVSQCTGVGPIQRLRNDMIAWTNTKLKFTSGIGGLGTAALLADISHQTLPIWSVMVIALLPVTVFVFVRPDEMPRSVVLPMQIFASVWYLTLSVILSFLFLRLPEKERGWPIYFIGLAVGAVPCFVVLWRWLRPLASK